MKYINREDLIAFIQERLLNESLQLDDTILDNIEKQQIDFVSATISGRFKTAEIFGNPPIRNGVIVQILSMLIVYWTVRRNAARKVPEDFISLYSEAIKLLNKIQSGEQPLPGLPPITAADGTTGKLMYGNNTNKDFFI